jgi:hypothetical protein
MKNTIKIAALVGLAGLSVAAHATFYTTESSFLAAISTPYYLEDFNDFTYGNPLNGSQTTWVAPGANGYGWTASEPSGGLYSNPSALSTNFSGSTLGIAFTGSPVTAFGGIFANTDVSGNVIAGTATLLMSNGDTMTVTSNTFLGWVGASAATGASLTSAGNVTSWVQADHVYTGQAATTPEPATLAVLGLGVAAMIRRRKKG